MKKLLLILLLLPLTSYGAVTFTPSGTQTLSTSIVTSCDTGDELAYYNNAGNLAGGDVCGDTITGFNSVTNAGIYTVVECDSTATVTCSIGTYGEMSTDSGYVSEFSMEWTEDPPQEISSNVLFPTISWLSLLVIHITQLVFYTFIAWFAFIISIGALRGFWNVLKGIIGNV